MMWSVPQNTLDIQQREFLDNLANEHLSGQYVNKLIEGFPGSGKTSLLLYAALYIRESEPDAKLVVVEFTHSLIDMLETAVEEMNIESIPVMTYYQFMKDPQPYDYILCDECQDIPYAVMLMIAKLASKQALLSGDFSQNIYETDPEMNQPVCTYEQLIDILHPEVIRLNIMHRLNKFIVKAIDSFLPNSKMAAGHPSMVKKNIKIRLWNFDNYVEESVNVYQEAKRWLDTTDRSIAILLPYKKLIVCFINHILKNAGMQEWKKKSIYIGSKQVIDFDAMNLYLKRCDIPIKYVANGFGDFDREERHIIIMTYHSSKGLDFDNVYLPYSIKANEYNVTPTLFMVAMTRSKQDLFISFSKGALNKYASHFQKECASLKIWPSALNPSLFDGLAMTPSTDIVIDDDLF